MRLCWTMRFVQCCVNKLYNGEGCQSSTAMCTLRHPHARNMVCELTGYVGLIVSLLHDCNHERKPSVDSKTIYISLTTLEEMMLAFTTVQALLYKAEQVMKDKHLMLNCHVVLSARISCSVELLVSFEIVCNLQDVELLKRQPSLFVLET